MHIPLVRGSSGGPGGNPLDPDTILANHYEIKALYQQEVIQLKNIHTDDPNMPFFQQKHTDDYFKMLKADGYSDDEAHAAATALFNKEFQESRGTPTDPIQACRSLSTITPKSCTLLAMVTLFRTTIGWVKGAK